MAEFQEVMKEWVRARKAINENELSCYPLEMFTDDHIANIEKEVMKWAAEHPEPVYPTYGEWFVEHGDLVDGWQCNTNAVWTANTARGIFMKPIPADIAQKLGIEPRER